MDRFSSRFHSLAREDPFDSSNESDEEMEEAAFSDNVGNIPTTVSDPSADQFFDFDSVFRTPTFPRSLSENFDDLPRVSAYPTPGFIGDNTQPDPNRAYMNLSDTVFQSFGPNSMCLDRTSFAQTFQTVDPRVVALRESSAAIPFPVDETMEDVCAKTPPASPSSNFLLDLDQEDCSQQGDFSHNSRMSMSPADSHMLTINARSTSLGPTSPSRFIDGCITFRGCRPPTPSNRAPSPPRLRQRSGADKRAHPDPMLEMQELQRQLRLKQIEEQEMSPQSSKPQYRRGDGTALEPKKKPRLKKPGKDQEEEKRDIFRCQSMPTTELEYQFNRQDQHDPLPTEPGSHSTRVINSSTLVKLIDGHYKEQIDGYFIIDCRYPYEFKGGHINGAQNIPPSESLAQFQKNFMERASLLASKRLAIVFHCEFSSKRGPSAYQLLRDLDRTANANRYPKLFFPYMYLLDGGYKEFFSQYPRYCYPMCYVQMKDKKYSKELKHNTKLKRISDRQRSQSCSNFGSLRASIGRTRSASREAVPRKLSQSGQHVGLQIAGVKGRNGMRKPLRESQR